MEEFGVPLLSFFRVELIGKAVCELAELFGLATDYLQEVGLNNVADTVQSAHDLLMHDVFAGLVAPHAQRQCRQNREAGNRQNDLQKEAIFQPGEPSSTNRIEKSGQGCTNNQERNYRQSDHLRALRAGLHVYAVS